MTIRLDSIRDCFEGCIPSAIATCAVDGTPNIALLSHVHYLDENHVALSFQFFNKTRANILANPFAEVQLVHPDNGAHFRLSLQYLRTETEGPVFESMRAKLAAIASHTGMSKVFKLLGSDIYRVLGVEVVPTGAPLFNKSQRNRLTALRRSSALINGAIDLDELLTNALEGLETHFGFDHSMLLMLDKQGGRLFTVASRGYERSGVGSEVPLGAGLIGVAARERTPIRIGHLASEFTYNLAVRKSLAEGDPAMAFETQIPFPGLPAPRSQLAVPIVRGNETLGVLYVESDDDMRFTHEDEDALTAIANQLAIAIDFNQCAADATCQPVQISGRAVTAGAPVSISHYAANHSIFIGDEYLIKGVAGAIFWKVLHDHVKDQRCEFSNRELRLDPSLGLPDLSDNLEARLILLQKRLTEKCPFLHITKTGRGRFRLDVERPVRLLER